MKKVVYERMVERFTEFDEEVELEEEEITERTRPCKDNLGNWLGICGTTETTRRKELY